MGRNPYHTVRLEPTQTDYLEEVHENHEGYNSIKHFSERAVAENAQYIQGRVNGAADLRKLIQTLCRVDGISVELPQRTFNTKLRGENLSSATKVNLSPQDLNSLSKITRSTGLSKGGAIRLCIIRELHKLSTLNWLLHEPRQSDIQNSWNSIENNIEDLFSSLLSKLETKMVKHLDSTQQKVREDPKAGKELSAHYENYFQDSPGYQRLQETERGRRVISGFEALPHGWDETGK